MDAQTTLVMGILNVTPDSFSDGGHYLDSSAAIEHGLALNSDGATIVDVGGESTRPGAARVSPEEEAARVIPVVRALADEGIAVSIDTMHASTALAAVDAGAAIINDVSGGLADPAMARAVAASGVDYVCMHWRAHSTEMDAADAYDDVVGDVARELGQRVSSLVDAGVDPHRIILDPGLGFSKVGASNWPLLARMDDWSYGYRVLIGASRKRFLGQAIGAAGGDPADASVREAATTAVTTVAALHGAWAVRVHDAAAARDAIAVVKAVRAAGRASADDESAGNGAGETEEP